MWYLRRRQQSLVTLHLSEK
jgi:hypothetical protein